MATPVPIELIQAARDGGPAPLERLLEVVWPDAYRLAYAILGEPQSAQDAAQEACIIVYRTIASLRNVAAFRVWLYRIVVREAAEIKRRRPLAEQAVEMGPEQHQADPGTAIDVWRALSFLPQHLRDVVVLRYFEDLPSREIASILRSTDAVVRFRLTIAKRRLRPLLADTLENITHKSGEVRTNAI